MAQFVPRFAQLLNDVGRRACSSSCVGVVAAFGATGLVCSTQVAADERGFAKEPLFSLTTRGKWGMDRPALPEHRTDRAVLLISDLDGTLVGDDEALHRFNCFWLSRQLPEGSILAYNTARDLKLFSGLLHNDFWGKPALLRPDALILAEGTQIWRFDPSTGEPRLDDVWHSKLVATWDSELVSAECAKLNQPWLVEDHEQDTADLRATIFIKGTAKESGEATAKLRQLLGPAYHLVDVECWKEGVRMISVLPAAAGKGAAADYLRQTLGFAPDRTMWAGDTRGDSSMLKTPIRGTLVGNATPELRADAAIAILQGAMGRVWTATGKHAEGVLEGLRHFGLE